MRVLDGEELTLCVGARKPNVFKYWTPWSGRDFAEKSKFLDGVRWKGLGYGFAYYYNGEKIWFRNEKDLTMFVLKFGFR